jgi:capsular exopolysaccharide synthesis family protein
MPEYRLSTIDNPKSLTAEVYRTLRTNIQFVSIDTVVKSILFTSAIPREGKSSVVANLATSMSQAGKNVLIIDADLRKPSQHKIFDLPNLTGLTTTLVSNVSAFEHIVETKHEGLDILTAGPNPPNPAELLNSFRNCSIRSTLFNSFDLYLTRKKYCLTNLSKG